MNNVSVSGVLASYTEYSWTEFTEKQFKWKPSVVITIRYKARIPSTSVSSVHFEWAEEQETTVFVGNAVYTCETSILTNVRVKAFEVTSMLICCFNSNTKKHKTLVNTNYFQQILPCHPHDQYSTVCRSCWAGGFTDYWTQTTLFIDYEETGSYFMKNYCVVFRLILSGWSSQMLGWKCGSCFANPFHI